MRISKSRLLRLGLLVIAGLVLFISAIYYLGNKKNIFSSTITVKSYFSDVKGLDEGSYVRYSGINIGTISEISIISDSTILVEMLIESKVREFIRKNSIAQINNNGLMGSKIVNISPGSPDEGSVEDGDIINSVEMIDFDEVLKEAQTAFDVSKRVTRNISEITEKINSGNGDLANLLNNNSITTKLNKTGDEILGITENLGSITEKVNNGEGDLGRFVNDTIMSSDLKIMIRNIDNLARKSNLLAEELILYANEINSGDGILNRLAYDSVTANKIDTSIENINTGMEKVGKAAETIEESWIIKLFNKQNK